MDPPSTLSAWDYVVIVAMLLVSATIGVFFAYTSRRQQSSDNYFLGDRGMSVFPVAVSLTATFISAINYLGTPAEVYIHGPMFGLMVTVRLFVPFVVMYCFIPVFYSLEITSIYEYLEKRFNNTTRFLIIAVEFVGGFIYMGILVYAPSLALSTVTGLSLSFSILTIGLICTFYTTIGGIKAVIWTDVFQGALMLLGTIIMICVGTIKYGGPAEGWRRAEIGERTQLVDFSVNPTIRLTFWSIYIGGGSFLLALLCTKQSYIQRYLVCRSVGDAQLAAWLGMFGTAVLELLAVTVGMTVFAYYYNCDPLTSEKIQRPDQIVPYFIMDVFASSPGVPGLLISGALCASLSSMSSVLSSIVAITGQDIIKTAWPDMSEYRYSVVIRIISASFGLFTTLLAFLASVLGDVLQATLTITGLFGGASFGVFILGLFFPRANSAGATSGLITGTLVGLFFYIGSRFSSPVYPPPPLTDEGCGIRTTNQTTSHYAGEAMITGIYQPLYSLDETRESTGNSIFALSYMYYMTVTAVSCIVIGLVVSYATSKGTRQLAPPSLLAPIIARRYRGLKSDVKNSTTDPNEWENVGIEMN